MTEGRDKVKRPLQETYYYPVIFMVVVTVVFISVLAYLNDSTRETIKRAGEIKERESILYVLGIEHDSSFDGILAAYDEQVIEEDYGYVAKKTGYVALFFSGSGLWGEIDGFISISDDMKTLKGLVFTEQSETPGLGGRIDELWFREQFRGVALDSAEGDLIKYRPEPGGNVDAISGATSTSKAVLKILNPFLRDKIDELKGGE
jgi:Na+-transporting NADH:ubiquinone oxidoreductase subunit C